MIFSSKTEQWLFEKLKAGPNTIPNLIESYKPPFSKEALYAAVLKLQKLNIILKVGKTLSIDLVTVDKMYGELDAILVSYKKTSRDKEKNLVVDLEEGESITHSFKQYKNFTSFWSNYILNLLLVHAPANCLYFTTGNTATWYECEFKEARNFYKLMKERNITSLALLNDCYKLSVEKRKELSSLGCQIGYTDLLPRFTEFNVIGDFVIDVTYIPLVSLPTYNDAASYNHYIHTFFKEAFAGNIRSKIKITRNKKKAQALLTRYKKLFVLPKGI